MSLTTIETKKEILWVCDRCKIDSTMRMCPCPRGSCDAEIGGEIVVTTAITRTHKNERKNKKVSRRSGNPRI